MIPVTSFAGRRVAVFGLGGSGTVTARALVAGGADVLADDDNDRTRGAAAEQGIVTGSLRDADWSGFDALVLAPGVPLTHPVPHWSVDRAKHHNIEIIGDIELFCRERRAMAGNAGQFIAITGTNGKSTTTALIGHVLRSAGIDAQIGGNIGRPILDLEPPSAHSCHVIECSSYQIDLAPGLAPTIGLFLNLSPDHIDRHGTIENYAAIKERLVARSDIAVIGIDDPLSAAAAERLQAAGHTVLRISSQQSLETGVFARGTHLIHARKGTDVPVADLAGIGSLRGAHNAQNAAAAFATCHAAGLAPEAIANGLKTFPGLAHRMEQIAKIGHVLFVNDSKATNADAAERALSSFERIYWLAGGRAKEGGIRSLVDYADRIAGAYLYGEARDDFAQTLKGHCPVTVCSDLAEATRSAFKDSLTDSGAEPVVLLSPACASFDQFRSFEVRGDAFRALVGDLAADTPPEGGA